MRLQLPIGCAVSCLVMALSGGTANATYHAFRVAEVYSNPSGTVQFIELHEVFGFNGENFLTEAPDIKSGTHDFVFPNDLPNGNTAHTDFLLGTAGYNALAGAPHADYTIPDGFFNPAGDSLQYGSTGPFGIVDSTTFGALPTDPSQALIRQGTSGSSFTAGPAIANTFSNGGNFAVPEPGSLGLAVLAGFALLARRRAGEGR